MANFPSSSTGFGLNKFEKTNALGSTTITNSITAGALSIAINAPSNVTTWPTANFVVRINNELIFCDSRTSSTLTVNASGRGYNGTTAATHPSGDKIRVIQSSKFIQTLAEETEALTKMFVGETDADITVGTGNIFKRQGSDGFVGIRTASPGSALDVNGQVTATFFAGDGSALTGITGATGGVSNTGSTTVAADTDEDGAGVVALQTRNSTRFTVQNNGRLSVDSGSLVWQNLGAGGNPVFVSDSADKELDLEGTLRLSSGSLVWTNAGAGSDPSMASDAADRRVKLHGTMEAGAFVGDGSSLTSIPAAGSSGGIQFNDGSSGLTADSNLFWDNTDKTLGVGTSTVEGGRVDIRRAQTLTIGGTQGGNEGTLSLIDTSALAADIGGSLLFGGTFASAGDKAKGWAAISGNKTTASSGIIASYLAFYTQPSGSGLAERMRIDSAGNVGIGTDTPDRSGAPGSGAQQTLHVQAPAASGDGANINIDSATSGSSRLIVSENDVWKYHLGYDGGNNRFIVHSSDTDGSSTDGDILRIPDGQLTVDGNATFDDSAFDWVCQSCYKSWSDWPGGACTKCGGSVDWHDDAGFLHELTHSNLGKMKPEVAKKAEAFGILKRYEDGQAFISMNKAPLFNFSAIAQIWKRNQELEQRVKALEQSATSP